MRPPRRTSGEPSLAVAILWLLLAAGAIVMFLGGIHFLFGGEDGPLPAPTVTVTETASGTTPPSVSDGIPDDALPLPTPSVCTDADARGVIPRDRWTPCGDLLGYFDGWATLPPPAAGVIMEP